MELPPNFDFVTKSHCEMCQCYCCILIILIPIYYSVINIINIEIPWPRLYSWSVIHGLQINDVMHWYGTHIFCWLHVHVVVVSITRFAVYWVRQHRTIAVDDIDAESAQTIIDKVQLYLEYIVSILFSIVFSPSSVIFIYTYIYIYVCSAMPSANNSRQHS